MWQENCIYKSVLHFSPTGIYNYQYHCLLQSHCPLGDKMVTYNHALCILLPIVQLEILFQCTQVLDSRSCGVIYSMHMRIYFRWWQRGPLQWTLLHNPSFDYVSKIYTLNLYTLSALLTIVEHLSISDFLGRRIFGHFLL